MGEMRKNAENIAFVHGNPMWLTLGGRDAYIIRPRGSVDVERRWVWIAPAHLAMGKDDRDPLPTKVDHGFYVESFLAMGVHVVGVDVGVSLGSPAGVHVCERFYELLVREYHLNPKARMIGQSNGGLIAYAWAFRNANRVDRIFGIYPSLDLRSWPGIEKVVGSGSIGDKELGFGDMTMEELKDRLDEFNPIDNLQPLVTAGVKIFHIHGDNDCTVPFEPNTGEALRRYRTIGGNIEVEVLPGVGHSPGPGFYDSQKAVEFLLA